MIPTLYGIPNCDQVRKARTWLTTHSLDYDFHDFKKSGITSELIHTWMNDIPWDILINRKGTTWRALSEERKAAIIDAKSAEALMLESPSIIKRPVLLTGDAAHVGFSPELYQHIFKK